MPGSLTGTPSALVVEINVYSYGMNSPYARFDPLGLDSQGGVAEFLSFVWQLPQNLVGTLASIGAAPADYDARTDTAFESGRLANVLGGVPVTLGNYVLLPSNYVLSDRVRCHELSHRDQSADLGPLYLPSVLIGYPIGALRTLAYLDSHEGVPWKVAMHDANPMEMDADARSGNADNINSNWAIKSFWLGR